MRGEKLRQDPSDPCLRNNHRHRRTHAIEPLRHPPGRFVAPGLVPGIHVLLALSLKPWMAGTSPGMANSRPVRSVQCRPFGHQTKIDQPDQRCPVSLGFCKFIRRLSFGAAVRAPHDNAEKHRCNGCHHDSDIEVDRAEKHRGKYDRAAGQGDPARQNVFAAAFYLRRKRFDLRFEAHDLVMRIAVVHGSSRNEPARDPYSAATLVAGSTASTLAAQNLNSGILPNGSSLGLVRRFAAASTNAKGMNTTPSGIPSSCRELSSTTPRRVVTRTMSPGATPSLARVPRETFATAEGSSASSTVARRVMAPVCQCSSWRPVVRMNG